MKTLKPFQSEAVQFILNRRNVLLADAMGLGKTFSTLSAVECLFPDKVLIVCPASIKEQWAREIKAETCFFPSNVQIVSGRACKITGDVVIINYDLLSGEVLAQLKQIRFDVGIYDEVHYCKSMEAKRTKAVFGKAGLVHSCARNILLTGTPILNRPIELYPMLKVLAPEVLGKENTYEKFGVRFCQGWFDGYVLNVQGSSNEDELARRLKVSGFILRRTEKDVELQLPAKRTQVFVIDADGESHRQLVELEKGEFKKQRFTTDEHIATIRRELAEKKVQKSMPLIKDLIEQAGKMVIFAYHKSVIDQLRAEIPLCVRITGDCDQRERAVALKMFKEMPEVTVILCQITAGGQGIDGMQNVCNHCLFVETSWTPAEIDQAIARVHRMGQTKSVLVQFIVWGKSIESHLIRTCLDKTEVIQRILG
jgi:SWI/SNF-related matrix-associated actin-dependent regulator 1 of chromatin subfamily A